MIGRQIQQCAHQLCDPGRDPDITAALAQHCHAADLRHADRLSQGRTILQQDMRLLRLQVSGLRVQCIDHFLPGPQCDHHSGLARTAHMRDQPFQPLLQLCLIFGAALCAFGFLGAACRRRLRECRERTRGAIAIPGDRPSGVLTAGAAQRYINMEGYMPGKEVLILGSGDIGLIMARRMTLEGAKVKGVIELMPYSNGLNRNIVQCLNDYNIPLYLSHTVTDIIGRDRLEKVIIAKVDKKGKIIKGTEIEFDVDTLLLSVGLIPENELSTKAGIDKDIRTNGLIVSESMETSIRGVFACGNVLHVHDLVDFVTEEAKRAGRSVAKYLRNELDYSNYLHVKNGKSIKYVIPQKINIQAIEDNLTMLMRVDNIYHNKKIVVKCDETVIAQFNRKHLAPSEMEKVIISKSIIEKVKGDLVVSLEDGE